MKRKIVFLGLIGCVLTATVFIPANESGSAQQTYHPEYSLAVGSEFTVTGTHHFERETILPDGDITGNTIDHELELDFSVRAADAARGLDLEMVILKLHRESINPGGTFHERFAELTGRKLDMRLSPEGELSGLEETGGLPQRDLLLQITAPDAFIDHFHYGFPSLPGHSVAIGETWVRETSSLRPFRGGAQASVINRLTYRLIGETLHEGIPCLEIEVVTARTNRVDLESHRGPITAEWEGRGREKIYFDHKRGMLLHREGSLEIEGHFGESEQKDLLEYVYSVKIAR